MEFYCAVVTEEHDSLVLLLQTLSTSSELGLSCVHNNHMALTEYHMHPWPPHNAAGQGTLQLELKVSAATILQVATCEQ